jgi:hypothetical protein
MTKSMADVALEGWQQQKPNFRVLYKFQRINDYSLDALKKQYVYFSRFEQLNDPFDPFLTVLASRLDGVSRAMFEKGMKIFCLSEDPGNLLMWAHYGDAGAGMRIGYAVFTGNPQLFMPVKYLDKFVGKFGVVDLLLMKATAWDYEQEWRACIGGEDQVFPDFVHPVSVCLGPRCSNENAERVRAALPPTVTDFEIILPGMANGEIHFTMHKVDDVIRHFGGIPDLRDLYDGGNLQM